MAFTYDFTTAPLISYVRLLIPDTDPANPIFQDAEIQAFYFIQSQQFQSSMKYSGPAGQNLPSSPVSYLRVAALALGTLAGNSARLSAVIGLLDVKLDPSKASDMLRAQAAEYRAIDDDAGAFAIIEQCTTSWGFIDRYWSQVQRQSSM
jgi:hypothetical protein